MRIFEEHHRTLSISANIIGTDYYETELIFNTDSGHIIDSYCDCPYGGICKHIAALGLFALKQKNILPQKKIASDDIFAAFTEGKSQQKPQSKSLTDLQIKVDQGYIVLHTQNYDNLSRQMFSDLPLVQRLFLYSLFPEHNPTPSVLMVTASLLDDFLQLLPDIELFKSGDYQISSKSQPLDFWVRQKGVDVELLLHKQPEIVLGNDRCYIFEHNTFFPIKSVPTQLLKILVVTQVWQVPVLQAAQMQNAIKILRDNGHNVVVDTDFKPPNIFTSEQIKVIFALSKTAPEGIRYSMVTAPRLQLKIYWQVCDQDKKSQHFNFLEIINKGCNYFYGNNFYKQYQSVEDQKPLIRQGNKLLYPLSNGDFIAWDEDLAQVIIKTLVGGDDYYQGITKDSLKIDLPSDRARQLVNKITAAVKKHRNWELVKSKDLEKLDFKKKSIKFDFDFSLKDSETDWFDFKLETQLAEHNLKLEDLKRYINSYDDYLEFPEGEYVQIDNKMELQRMLAFQEKCTVKNGKCKARLWQMPEILQLIEDSKQTDFKTNAEFNNFLTEAKSGKPVEPVKMPRGIAKTLRHYQKDGVAWGHFLRKYRFGGILGDDMGLGKTIQTLALLLQRGGGGPALVVAPTSVCNNWETETQKFAPTLNPIMYRGNNRALIIEKASERDIIIVTYGLLQQDSELFLDKKWHSIVLDEAQAIKNVTAKRTRTAHQLEGDFKLVTTGTPIENHLGELWSLFRFLNPGLLGSQEQFMKRYMIPIERNNDNEVRQHLKRLIQAFMLRRLKVDVLDELPPKTEITVKIPLSDKERAMYEAVRLKALQNIASKDKEKAKGSDHLKVLAAITKLRLASCHPKLIMPDSTLPSSKLERFAELVDGKTITTKSLPEIIEAEEIIQQKTAEISNHIIAATQYGGEAFDATQAA